jgi:threonyl-tRNA synthetase
MIRVTLPDKSVIELTQPISVAECIKTKIGEGLSRAALVATLNNTTVDLATVISTDCTLVVHTAKDETGKKTLWHSCAHVLAIATMRLFPKTKLTIGPATDDGFYYDFHTVDPFTQEHILAIEEEMKKVVKEDLPFVRETITYENAKTLFADNPFKLELIEEHKESGLSIYKTGTFFDLCIGPHVPSTGKIKALKLTKTSGAYWRADATKAQLQRVYGIAFTHSDELKQYIERIETAKARDHRKLLVEHELGMFHEYAPGNTFLLPKGTTLYNTLVQFIRTQYAKRGYTEVITPQLFNKELWVESGHWSHYKEDMFVITVEGQEHSLKPMNCPSHCLIFRSKSRSYKELPLRIADFGVLHRNELSGALSGMTRVRKFSQDDAHIFCTFDQIQAEVADVLDFIHYVWKDIFGFTLKFYLSTRPEKYLGTIENWDNAEKILGQALASKNIPYTIKQGDGAFYGPKIDIDLEDALGRKWQCPTCQLDFNLPERFGLKYEGNDGKQHQPVMIHRAILGSVERFMAIMIEHYAAKFPLWLSPEQVRILPIADRHVPYCEQVCQVLKQSAIRATVDTRAMTTQNKIRLAQESQVNYILVCGDSEVKNETVNVRTRETQVLGEQQVSQFIQTLLAQIQQYK